MWSLLFSIQKFKKGFAGIDTAANAVKQQAQYLEKLVTPDEEKANAVGEESQKVQIYNFRSILKKKERFLLYNILSFISIQFEKLSYEKESVFLFYSYAYMIFVECCEFEGV